MENTKQILAAKEHTGAGVPSAGRRTAATGTGALSKGGKRRSRRVPFSRIMARVSRLFAPFPGISHLFPLDFFRAHKISRKGMNQGIGQGIVRPRQGRTGLAALFRGLSPTAIHVQATSWRGKVRKSSDCFTKLRDVSRKFAQIRPVNPRCYALLRVGPIFSIRKAGKEENRNGNE